MQWVLIVIGILLALLLLPMVFYIGISFDVLNGFGGASIRLFGIAIIKGKVLLQNGNIVLAKHKPNPMEEHDVIVEPEEVIVAFNLTKGMIDKINLHAIMLSGVYGGTDPMQVCITKAAIEALQINALCILKAAKRVKRTKQVCYAGFGDAKFVLGIKVHLSISLYHIVHTIITSRRAAKMIVKGEPL